MKLRTHLVWVLPVLLGTSAIACDSKGDGEAKAEAKSDDKSDDKAAPEAKAEAGSAPAAGAQASELPDPCKLVDEAVLRAQVGLAADAPVEVGDQLEAAKYNDDAVSCTWRFEGQMIGLQVTREPAGNKFDTWASRMVEAKQAEGFEALEGLGASAVFRAKDSHLMFRHSEGMMYSLSYAGDRPGVTMEAAKLQAIAATIPAR